MHRSGCWRVIIITSLVICGAYGVIVLLPKIQMEHTLQALDEHFMTPIAPLAADASGILIFPHQVGDFRSVGTSQYKTRVEAVLDSLNEPYLNRRYVSPQYDVYVDAVLNPDGQIENFTDAGSSPCAAELGGENVLRITAKISFTYHACANSPILSVDETVDSVTWRNGNWRLYVSGDVQGIIGFLTVYPY